ncbi:MAG: hypothetical protein Q8J66_09240 [Methylotenera sp.]|nr:hypothetical protein [Methylotenera sp.]
MKLTKEQKTELAQKLTSPWGAVKLICDGFTIDLQVQRMKGGMTYRVMTFVNGQFKGEWVSSTQEHPQQKFLRKSERPLYSASHKATLEKIYGKRHVANTESYQKKYITYMPDFASGKAAISHLCKVSESIQVVHE